jgi:hypothetical protein
MTTLIKCKSRESLPTHNEIHYQNKNLINFPETYFIQI